ncbi:calcium ABC transporter ATPase [Fusobacterium nucleatum YWH7199]|nr:calcium ABC transporter ATPase [Fusobacterium nucleatum YWH7056]MCL4581176.1 calcium ABC transporter ATPase [Fusobacterium nucleatum YWH7199]MCL4583133.1 calcium ABC transporter ATPase [Fusobacterium nucleatum YWH7054]MCL4591478.1 calcium ABC transporter ATPase [Fusobacterium nucleatum YWH7053]
MNIKINKKSIDFIYFLCYNYSRHKKLKIFLIIKGSSYNHSINITKFISGTVTIIGNKTFGMNLFISKVFFMFYKL